MLKKICLSGFALAISLLNRVGLSLSFDQPDYLGIMYPSDTRTP
jgi:hypothetical protein